MTPIALPCLFLCAALTAAPGADGRHDFDWEIGHWKTHVARLAHPLSGAKEWLEYDGTSVVTRLVGGQANIVELDIAGPAGAIQGVSLRLYDPQARRWSLHYASVRSGVLTPPVVGAFAQGRGEFFGSETLDGRAVKVRFRIGCTTPDRCRFEQAFSADDGATWEDNWIATDERLAPTSPG